MFKSMSYRFLVKLLGSIPSWAFFISFQQAWIVRGEVKLRFLYLIPVPEFVCYISKKNTSHPSPINMSRLGQESTFYVGGPVVEGQILFEIKRVQCDYSTIGSTSTKPCEFLCAVEH